MRASEYPTSLSDEQWQLVEPLLPPLKRTGRPPTVDRRLVFDTIVYVLRSGCQWSMIPKDLAKRSTANDCFTAWRDGGVWQTMLDALRRQARVAAGRDPAPATAAIDTQTVKGSEVGGPRGYDGGKKINGRKRHLLVDSLGILLVVLVTSAHVDDGTHAPQLLARLTPEHTRRLGEIRGDGKYHNHALRQWLKDQNVGYQLTVVERPKHAQGFVLLPYRWVVERTNAWMGKYRRHSKDYERTCESAESWLRAAAIHRLLNRLAPPNAPANPFRYARTTQQNASCLAG